MRENYYKIDIKSIRIHSDSAIDYNYGSVGTNTLVRLSDEAIFVYLYWLCGRWCYCCGIIYVCIRLLQHKRRMLQTKGNKSDTVGVRCQFSCCSKVVWISCAYQTL